ncbi:MAG TPA: site-specific DNA-methyltransferase [Clostridia bacterium]|nr:site-specific DNA-methyltransferase [Clostridia bacterium]
MSEKPVPVKLDELESFMLELQNAVMEGFSSGKTGKELLEDLRTGNKAVPEKYELCWTGKREAPKLANTPPCSVLEPVVDESVEPVSFDPAEHIFIEGENLETLKLLLEDYESAVKMIYIDPPYNKGKEFVYNDNFKKPLRDYLLETGQIDGKGNPLAGKLETAGRFHSYWLNMMYPRLVLARRLLREDGAIFVSIDDNEVHNLRFLMNEIFGEDNFVNMLHVKRAAKNVNQQFRDLKRLNLGIEYVLVYRKSQAFSWINPYKEASEQRKEGYWTSFYNNANRPTMRYELLGVNISQGQWKWRKERALKAVENFRRFQELFSYKTEKEELALLKEYWLDTGKKKEFIKLKNGRPHYWVKPSEKQLRTTDWTDLYINDNSGKSKFGFDTAKSVKALKAFIGAATKGRGDIVLDFFAGSGTTGEAVMALNAEDGGTRNSICVQVAEPLMPVPGQEGNPQGAETIADICRTRLAGCAKRYLTGLRVYRLKEVPGINKCTT